jgi:hypothetical protein
MRREIKVRKISIRLIAAALATALAMPAGAMFSSAFAQTPQIPGGQQPGAQVQQPDQGGVNWGGVGYGAGSVVTNLVYIPAKLVYAILGGLVGGGAYLVTAGNSQTADTIWRSSLGGDYVITPDMLAGKQALHFSGPTYTPPDNAAAVQPIAPAPAAAMTPTTPLPSSGAAGWPNGQPQPMDKGTGGAPSMSIE